MSTVTIRIGPQDHGVRMSLADFEFAEVQEGYHYELSRGVVTVIDVPKPEHMLRVDATREQFSAYRRKRRGRIQAVASGGDCKILVVGMQSERHPDLAIYLDPLPEVAPEEIWRVWIPAIVIEIVSPSSAVRDYGEKRDDYFRAGIQEYWIIDPGSEQMLVLRRGDGDWIEQVVSPPELYRPELLPGFKFSCQAVFDAAR